VNEWIHECKDEVQDDDGVLKDDEDVDVDV
jgi:hypothetical protein